MGNNIVIIRGRESARGEDRPGSGRRRFRFFRALRKQHGRPQRTNQYADAQRYDDAVLVLARRFRDHHVGNRAVHCERGGECMTIDFDGTSAKAYSKPEDVPSWWKSEAVGGEVNDV